MDVSANATNTAEQLQEFAVMGSLYSKLVLNKENQRFLCIILVQKIIKGDEMHQKPINTKRL